MMMSDHTAIKATTNSMDVSSFNNKNMHHHNDGNDDDSDHIYSNMSSSSMIDPIATMKSPTAASVTSGSSLNTNLSHPHHHQMDDNDAHSSQQDYQHHNDDDNNGDEDGKTKNVIIEQVVDPREVDVLCGRGGMSNHHAGNEWYRRLIRSNRPLYRACPKHTKLLVAKAIVQAVQEQKERFLERDIKTGIWYQIPYKRAVDKTSQGLRERDRDDPTNDGTSSNKFDIQPYMSFPSIDDKASSGGSTTTSNIPTQNANNNQVSFSSSQALSTKKSKTSIPKSMGQLKQTQSGKTQQQQLSQINPNLSSTTNSITTNITTKKKAVPLKSALKKFQKDIQYTNDNISHHQQVVSPTSTTVQQQQQPMSSMNFYNSSTTTSSNNMHNYNSSTTTSNNNMHNVIPLPTNYQSQPTPSTTLLRDTSMYRLLKHTQLLPQQSSSGSIMFHPTRVTNTVPSTADDTSIPYPNIQQQQPTSNSSSTVGRSTYIGYNDTNDDNMYSGIPMNTNNTNLSNIGGVSSTSPPESSSAASSTTPGLTRFTSQVSDWLNFFWPTNSSTPSGPIDENHNLNMNMTMNTNSNNNINHTQTMMMMNHNSNNNNVVQNNVFEQQISAVVQEAAATTGNNNNNNNNHFTSYQNTTNSNTNSNQTLSSSYNFNNINRNDFQQQQQQQQQLLQLHRQLSNEIDSVPFMNVIDNNNIIGNKNQTSLAGMNQLNFSFLPNSTLLTKTPVSYQQQQQQQQPQRNYFPDMTQQAIGDVNSSTASEITRKRKESGDNMNWLSENIQNKCMRMDDIDNTVTNNETATIQYQRMMVPLNDVMGKDDDDQRVPTTASATVLESAPSELEQSVSLTLLKLAASPSKLLSGLTSFFGDRTTSTTTLSSSITHNNNNNLLQQEQSPQQQQFDSTTTTTTTTTTLSGGINPVVGTSFQRKSQSSLLDDFEDSPMEKKLRSFHQFT